MKTSLHMVREFHDGTNIVTPKFACIPDWTPEHAKTLEWAARSLHAIANRLKMYGEHNGAPRCIVRGRIEIEELGEKLDAMARYDLLGVFDGGLDGRYVGDGTMIETGLEPVFDEGMDLVHTSNMSKRFPDGTILKGPNYVPVNLQPLLARVSKP